MAGDETPKGGPIRRIVCSIGLRGGVRNAWSSTRLLQVKV
ncbi:hypothetical protein YSA_02922 [Pseudomonas putida ND6]|uniref:Uncharacterized protein n=1 Tax=Pseudomonas putida ND6 TaxID=231023 RepID=I3US82_PSEPU|nr:hypothetical protein YSA_02922 [Pseudomonas putida ND6]